MSTGATDRPADTIALPDCGGSAWLIPATVTVGGFGTKPGVLYKPKMKWSNRGVSACDPVDGPSDGCVWRATYDSTELLASDQ